MNKVFLILCLLGRALISYSQDIVYNDDGSVTFNNKDLQSITYDNVDFSYLNLLKIDNSNATGIIGDIYQGGGIVLEVLGGLNKDMLIYKKTLVLSSSTFSGNTEDITWQGTKIKSDATKVLASNLQFATSDPSKCSALTKPTLFKAALASAYGRFYYQNPY